MTAASRCPPFAEFLRRLFAAGGAALVLALAVFAASPMLHGWLHGNGGGSDDDCAVVLFSNGVSAPLGVIAVAPPAAEWRTQPRAVAKEVLLTPPRFLHQPERGPPVG
jgi:hypothetical protein